MFMYGMVCMYVMLSVYVCYVRLYVMYVCLYVRMLCMCVCRRVRYACKLCLHVCLLRLHRTHVCIQVCMVCIYVTYVCMCVCMLGYDIMCYVSRVARAMYVPNVCVYVMRYVRLIVMFRMFLCMYVCM